MAKTPEQRLAEILADGSNIHTRSKSPKSKADQEAKYFAQNLVADLRTKSGAGFTSTLSDRLTKFIEYYLPKDGITRSSLNSWISDYAQLSDDPATKTTILLQIQNSLYATISTNRHLVAVKPVAEIVSEPPKPAEPTLAPKLAEFAKSTPAERAAALQRASPVRIPTASPKLEVYTGDIPSRIVDFVAASPIGALYSPNIGLISAFAGLFLRVTEPLPFRGTLGRDLFPVDELDDESRSYTMSALPRYCQDGNGFIFGIELAIRDTKTGEKPQGEFARVAADFQEKHKDKAKHFCIALLQLAGLITPPECRKLGFNAEHEGAKLGAQQARALAPAEPQAFLRR